MNMSLKIFFGAIWCDLVRVGANSAAFCGWGCDGDRRSAVSMQKRTADPPTPSSVAQAMEDRRLPPSLELLRTGWRGKPARRLATPRPRLPRRRALAKAGHPCRPGPFLPFPLQNVKEQARERRTHRTLPCFDGTAIKKFEIFYVGPGLMGKARLGTSHRQRRPQD
jgi:hypothetical protein